MQLEVRGRHRTTQLVMRPMERMQWLDALIPRPRRHQVRLHELLTPNAKLRELVVPKGPAKSAEERGSLAAHQKSPESAHWPHGSRWGAAAGLRDAHRHADPVLIDANQSKREGTTEVIGNIWRSSEAGRST